MSNEDIDHQCILSGIHLQTVGYYYEWSSCISG